MDTFIKSNPGLQSRFNQYIHFDNYSLPELTAILERFCQKGGYTLQDGFQELFSELLEEKINDPQFMETFSNARYVRNLYEKLIMAQSDRLSEIDISAADNRALMEITAQDLRAIIHNGEFDKTV